MAQEMTERKLHNKWSIKAVYYSHHNRQCYLDGPWKKTVQEAVKGFANYLRNKGLSKVLIFQCILAERCHPKICQAIDGKGNPYIEHSISDTDLINVGVKVHPHGKHFSFSCNKDKV